MAYQPKSYKKFVATAATATLVASAIAPVASAATFTDVNSNYTEAVNYLVANKIAQGTSDTTFGTTASITRGDAAVMIANALELNTSSAPDAGFKDLNTRVAGAVNALYAAKIIGGKSATSFAPDDKITRQEMAKVLSLAYELDNAGTNNTFVDVNSNWDTYVDALVKNKVTLGKTPTTFGATQNVTRGEFALFVFRAETLVPATPEVVSVSGLNATQVEVKFNQAVTAASVFADGESGAFKAINATTDTVEITALDNQAQPALTGVLSADGKTLTVTSSVVMSGRYDVAIKGLVAVKDAKDFVEFDKLVTFAADKTAPTVLGTSKPTSATVKVTFSEPIKSLGTVEYKLANGTVVAAGGTGVTNDFAPGAKSVTFTLGSSVDANTNVIATFIGTQDQAGNLISPNPTTVQLYKGAADGVAPTVASISQTTATKFAVKFSEQLQGKPTIKVGATTIDAANIVQDANDLTRYIVEAGVLDGATNVVVSAFTDLSGVVGTTDSRVVTFVKDAAAPKVTSSAVVVDATDKKEYLELTFDKDVAITGSSTVDATSGSYVKDFVTTNISDGNISPTTITYKVASNKKVVRVQLDTFLNTTFDVKGAVYTLNLGFANVASAAAISADTTKVTFTRGEDGTAGSVAVAKVLTVAQQAADNDKIDVTFDMAVDGASATNPANYNIDGAIVESVTLKPVSGTQQVAVLNLKADSNGFTGTRNINITNVKALGSSKVMEAYFTNAVEIKENVAPKVTSAKLTSTNTITLTFSEAVTSGSADDFEVLIGGLSQGTPDAVDAVVVSGNTATLTVSSIDATELAKGISLKALTTLDVKDAAGNTVSVPSNITVTQ